MEIIGCIPVRDEFYQSPPKTVKVLKASSCPETNDRPSFLTTLPAELRNNVYIWLFARDDPTIYTGPGRRDREPDFFSKFNDNYDEMPSFTPEEGVCLRRPSHDLGPSVAMLRTCRQIFHEAVGVLYSGNKIIVSVNLNNHNLFMRQFDDAREFLYSIGMQVAHVKEIEIDISPLCSAFDCDRVDDVEVEERIDLLPLARLKWYPPSSTCEFRLVNTGRALNHRVHGEFTGNSAHMSNINAQLLEDIVKAVGSIHALKTHGRFDRLIDRIELSLDLESGSVHYPITGPYHEVDKRTIIPFEILRDDQDRFHRLHWVSCVHTSDLHPLPPRVYRKVMCWVMNGGENIIFDLDCRNVYGLPFNILQVDRSMRSLALTCLPFYNQITIMMTKSLQRSNFDSWKSLKAWLEESISGSFPTVMKEPSPSHPEPPATIVLKVTLATLATLAELRIEITGLIRLTYKLRPYCLLRFELRSTREDGLEECSNHATTLLLLRKTLFVFISGIMEDYPWRKDDDCPEIWVNGYGQIVEATYPGVCDKGPQSVVNKDLDMAIDALELLGETYIKSLKNQVFSKTRSGAPRRFVSLRSSWPERSNALNESASMKAFWKSLYHQDWSKGSDSLRYLDLRLDTR
ncbi:hypothetical protein HBI25_004650 [Parastagonospora nodorum]|nr:hypothetical protein HBH74_082980 [Parastagonospora nodorum]KAH4997565.1 hypothetical protein HBH73_008200 [Parastagonospora nodorum]KAH5103693.1 hypothetical protein HBH72_074690 [Parastagonospora nodorum]KAH5280683.1 hypothetical protein HBI72_023410 [Parastagonospora nodorum]KAH5380770.1 hypothetical protein HBI49_008270 [Parastagonospora nodorum]